MLQAKKTTVVNASVNKVYSCLEVFHRYGEGMAKPTLT